MFPVHRGLVANEITAARVRKLLVRAEDPLLTWLNHNRRLTVTMVRDVSGLREVSGLLLWLAESENVQAVFRRIREFVTDDAMQVEPAMDVRDDGCDEVCDVLVRSVRRVIQWIEDGRNAPQLLSVLREIGETVDMNVIAERLGHDADNGYKLTQRAFQSIRLLMPSGRPNSGVSDLAGLAARASLM